MRFRLGDRVRTTIQIVRNQWIGDFPCEYIAAEPGDTGTVVEVQFDLSHGNPFDIQFDDSEAVVTYYDSPETSLLLRSSAHLDFINGSHIVKIAGVV
jgi:hypothetical protein